MSGDNQNNQGNNKRNYRRGSGRRHSSGGGSGSGHPPSSNRRPSHHQRSRRPNRGRHHTRRPEHEARRSVHQNPQSLAFDNLPNRITLFRVALVPFLLVLLHPDTLEFLNQTLFPTNPLSSEMAGWIAAAIFTLASLSDWLDGYLARRKKIVTVFGKFLDPIADKFLVISALVLLQHLDRIHPFIVVVLILREILIAGLRSMAAAEGVVIAASPSAKWKTGLQMFAIPFLMIYTTYPIPYVEGMSIEFATLGIWALYASIVISVFSAAQYLVRFFSGLKKRNKQSTVSHSRPAFDKRPVQREASSSKEASLPSTQGESDRNQDNNLKRRELRKDRDSRERNGNDRNDRNDRDRNRRSSSDHRDSRSRSQNTSPELEALRKEQERLSKLSLNEHRDYLKKEAERRSGLHFKNQPGNDTQSPSYDNKDPRSHMRLVSSRIPPVNPYEPAPPSARTQRPNDSQQGGGRRHSNSKKGPQRERGRYQGHSSDNKGKPNKHPTPPPAAASEAPVKAKEESGNGNGNGEGEGDGAPPNTPPVI